MCLFQKQGSESCGMLTRLPAPRFSLYEPVEFIRHFLMDRLEWRKVPPKALLAVTPHLLCALP